MIDLLLLGVIELFLFGALIALAWKIVPWGTRTAARWNAWLKHGRFIPGFATLLERPLIPRRGLRSYLSGVEQVGGDYQGRPVVLVLHHKSENDPGYLIVGMEATGAPATRAERSGALREWIHDIDARNALDDLELRHKLTLSLEDRWLKVTCVPIGFFGFFVFPGRFDEERWRNVLRAMHRVVVSLEGSASTARAPRS
jgi:hypothetical protein